MIYYSILCLAFGIVYGIQLLDIKPNTKLEWWQIGTILCCSFIAPILVVMAIAVWSYNQFKTI